MQDSSFPKKPTRSLDELKGLSDPELKLVAEVGIEAQEQLCKIANDIFSRIDLRILNPDEIGVDIENMYMTIKMRDDNGVEFEATKEFKFKE